MKGNLIVLTGDIIAEFNTNKRYLVLDSNLYKEIATVFCIQDATISTIHLEDVKDYNDHDMGKFCYYAKSVSRKWISNNDKNEGSEGDKLNGFVYRKGDDFRMVIQGENQAAMVIPYGDDNLDRAIRFDDFKPHHNDYELVNIPVPQLRNTTGIIKLYEKLAKFLKG